MGFTILQSFEKGKSSRTYQSTSPIALYQYCVLKKWDLFLVNEMDLKFTKMVIFSCQQIILGFRKLIRIILSLDNCKHN